MNSPMTVKTMITTTSPKGVNSGFAFFRRRMELFSLSGRAAALILRLFVEA
jgi:hypothetical protein